VRRSSINESRFDVAHALAITARSVAFIGDEIASCAPPPTQTGERQMWPPIRIFFRPDPQADVKLIRSARDAIARSIEILQSNPQPDTFLGRQTQELIPTESDAD
jgi:hypothetical protein